MSLKLKPPFRREKNNLHHVFISSEREKEKEERRERERNRNRMRLEETDGERKKMEKKVMEGRRED